MSTNQPAQVAAADGGDGVALDARRLRTVLIAVSIALMAVIASVSGLNVAQTHLAVEFGASQNTILWIINIYTLALAALLLPVVMDICRRTHIPPSRLLIPLAFSSLLGGLITMIGTPPNILIAEETREYGLEPFTLFDFTPVGLAVMLAGACFSVPFFKLSLGPVPLTADRLLLLVLIGQYALWRRWSGADPKPLGKP